MKIAFFALLPLAAFFGSCEKDSISRADITGTWILETRYVDTVYANKKGIDTTLTIGFTSYLIGNSDTLSICSMQEEFCNLFSMKYQPPNTLIYYTCPIGMECLMNQPLQYTIIKAEHGEMEWKREVKITDSKKIIEILYFTKQK